MDDGPSSIDDPTELAEVRRQMWAVHLQAFLAASLLTAGLLALP